MFKRYMNFTVSEASLLKMWKLQSVEFRQMLHYTALNKTRMSILKHTFPKCFLCSNQFYTLIFMNRSVLLQVCTCIHFPILQTCILFALLQGTFILKSLQRLQVDIQATHSQGLQLHIAHRIHLYKRLNPPYIPNVNDFLDLLVHLTKIGGSNFLVLCPLLIFVVTVQTRKMGLRVKAGEAIDSQSHFKIVYQAVPTSCSDLLKL